MEETRKPSIGQDTAIVSKRFKKQSKSRLYGNPEHNSGSQEKSSHGPILSVIGRPWEAIDQGDLQNQWSQPLQHHQGKGRE